MEYLKVFTSFIEIIEPLDDAERGRLFTAMLRYADNGEIPVLTGNERFVWAMAKQGIDRTIEKSADSARRGSLGGLQKQANRSKQYLTVANDSKTEQDVANDSHKDKDKDKDKDNNKDNDNKDQKRKRFIAPSINEVKSYCTEKGLSVDAEHFVAYYESNGWRVGKNPMKDWQAAVRTWSRNEYSSNKPQAPAKVLNAQNYTQRNYSDEEMNRLANRAWFEEIG